MSTMTPKPDIQAKYAERLLLTLSGRWSWKRIAGYSFSKSWILCL